MKRLAVLVAVVSLFLPLSAFAQTVLVNDMFSNIGSWQAAGGSWSASAGGLVQKDSAALLAKINRPAVQSGVTQYEFSVNYLAGGYKSEQDLRKGYYHGGFGIHIGIDKAAAKTSWGNGRSYLLWLNLDTRPETRAEFPEHYGFRAQVFRSEGNSKMTLVENIELPLSWVRPEYLAYSLPVKMVIDSNTGLVKIYDPTDRNYVYKFKIEGNLKGNFVSFRTNSLSAKFANFKVSRL